MSTRPQPLAKIKKMIKIKFIIVFCLIVTLQFNLLGQTEIIIYRDSVINTVNPYLFGCGDEINEALAHNELDSLVTLIGIKLFRMGGITTEYYDWEGDNFNGVTYFDLDVLQNIVTANSNFGIDSLLQFCEHTGMEPVITVGFQINDPAKVARLVEYCNGSNSSPMGAIRAQRGHPDPYNVIYWCIGNEVFLSGVKLPMPWGDWTMYRHFNIPFDLWIMEDSSFVTPQEYASLVGVFIDSMRFHSPIPVKIGVGWDNSPYFAAALESNNTELDWVDVHYYPCSNGEADIDGLEKCLAVLDTGGTFFETMPGFQEWYSNVLDSIVIHSGGNNLPAYIFEFNAGSLQSYNTWWEKYLKGIFLADVWGHFAVAGVPAAAVYSIYDEDTASVYSIFETKNNMLSMKTESWVLKAYNDFFGDTLIKANSNTFGLNAYSSLSNDTLVTFIVNKSLDSAYSTTITLDGFVSSGEMKVWDITNDTTLEAPYNGTKGIIYRGSFNGDSTIFAYTFPKTSLTILKIPPKDSSTGSIRKNEIDSPLMKILQVYPNPFSNSTTIAFSMSGNSQVNIDIYNILGKLVKKLANNYFNEGEHTLIWEGRSEMDIQMPEGIYLIKFQTMDCVQTKQIILLR